MGRESLLWLFMLIFFFLMQPWRCIKDLSLFKYYLGLKVTRFQQGNAILKYVPTSFERDRDASTKASRWEENHSVDLLNTIPIRITVTYTVEVYRWWEDPYDFIVAIKVIVIPKIRAIITNFSVYIEVVLFNDGHNLWLLSPKLGLVITQVFVYTEKAL